VAVAIHRRIFLFHRITCADALLMARPGVGVRGQRARPSCQ
jgi:hypothetical protein